MPSITIAGASYPDVPAIECPIVGGGTATFLDTTIASDAASASDILSGKKAYVNGSLIEGTGTGGGTAAISIVDTPDASGGDVRTITALDISDTTATAADVINSKWFYTADGTRTQGTGTGGTSKNTQIVQGTTRTNSSSATAIGSALTVSKSGTYDIYWTGFRTNTSASYTWATQLYIGGTAHGSENTTWTNNQQNNHLSNVSLTANQTLRVYGRETRGSSYYVCAPTLVIVEA